MNDKLGVYICKGCEIGKCVDTDRLAQIATEEFQIPIVRTSTAFCLEDTQQIRDDVTSEGLSSVVIAACSGRVNTDVFSLAPTLVERVNLREQVAWNHAPNEEETQSLGNDYLRMGIVRAQKKRRPTAYTEANERTVLVVGGGIAGMAAALDTARAGYGVVLVEKTGRLGGFAQEIHRQYPTHPPYTELEDTPLQPAISAVEENADIRICLDTEITGLAGQPGRFEVTLGNNGATETVMIGAVVFATGWKPYDARTFANYGFGQYQNVVTNVTFEAMAAAGRITRPSDDQEIKNVAIIQCETPVDEAHLPYSGNVTSLVSLKHAAYVREHHPNACVFLFYQDMHTPGQHEYFYKHLQQDARVFFSRGEVKRLGENDDSSLTIEVDNSLLGDRIRIQADLVVLATGMTPACLEDGGLNLAYLQGSELPTTPYGYADSNYICFPYETRRTGIYSAGCVRKPMDLAASEKDGAAAALKAIQSIESSAAGTAVHPRVGDLSYPSFFTQKCTSCGRCTQECPFGALELDEKKRPLLDPNRCRRCGICMGACPVQIISFDDYSVDMLSSMINAVDIPLDDEDKPRILAFACENDAYPALDMAGIDRRDSPVCVRVVPVRCLGSVNSILITDALSRGFDGVVLLGCKSGDDYQCHFIHGSELSGKRMGNVQETLDRLALESERVEVIEIEISDADRVAGMLAGFVEKIQSVGLNPFKGF